MNIASRMFPQKSSWLARERVWERILAGMATPDPALLELARQVVLARKSYAGKPVPEELIERLAREAAAHDD